MESRSEDNFSWLFGLRSYFNFIGDLDNYELLKNVVALKYGKPEDLLWIVKNVCIYDINNYTTDYAIKNRDKRFDIYFDLAHNIAGLDIHKVLYLISLVNENHMTSSLQSLIAEYKATDSVLDAFSKGQVISKVWLVETLQKLINPVSQPKNIILIGGWLGQLTHYLNKKISYQKCYNIDPHQYNSYIGHKYFNYSNDSYVPVSTTIETVEFVEGHGYKLPIGRFDLNNDFKFVPEREETVMPQLVVNTSCEHMSDQWFNQAPANTMIVLQTNNLFGMAPDHFNCVHKLSDLDKKYHMNKVLFQGELDIGVGKRFMKIGIK